MKASKLRTIWIMIRSLYILLGTCSRALVNIYLGRQTRERTDRMAHSFGRRMLEAIKLNYECFNPHDVAIEEGKPHLIMCNHSSLYDIPLSFVTLPGSVRMITKKELCQIPIFGTAMIKTDFVSIDRKDRKQAIRDLAIAKEKLKSGIVLWMAPEGTRSRDGSLGKFKKGGFITAIQTGARIIPVGIRGLGDVLPPDTWQFHLNQHAEIHIGKPIDASEYTQHTRDELMAAVEKEIRDAADLHE